ncbi:MAG: hypothetical protein HOA01_00465 [Flavobacteriales bacterium]|jgi:hypothetical protein|nr:hypothetical protein [Flavobacteriales bacterium]
MKKILFVLGISLVFLSSCEKTQYCASCVEYYSGYVADDFCSDNTSVDNYIEDLESTTSSGGFAQDWYCDKYAE